MRLTHLQYSARKESRRGYSCMTGFGRGTRGGDRHKADTGQRPLGRESLSPILNSSTPTGSTYTGRGIVMDMNQDIWDRLREQGHVVGTPYAQAAGGLLVLVDDVAMSTKDARALAHGHVTLAQIRLRTS